MKTYLTTLVVACAALFCAAPVTVSAQEADAPAAAATQGVTDIMADAISTMASKLAAEDITPEAAAAAYEEATAKLLKAIEIAKADPAKAVAEVAAFESSPQAEAILTSLDNINTEKLESFQNDPKVSQAVMGFAFALMGLAQVCEPAEEESAE